MNAVVDLDVGTLMFSLSMTMWMATALIGMFWWRHRAQVSGLGWWSVAAASMALGSVLVLLQDHTIDFISLAVANTLVHAGANGVGLGMHRFQDRPIGAWGWISGGVFAVTTAVFVLSSLTGRPEIGIRLMTSTACLAVAMIFTLAGTTSSFRRTLPGVLLTAAAVLTIIVAPIRIVYTALHLEDLPLAVIQQDPVHSLFVLAYFTAGIVIVFALSLTVPSWLRRRERELAGRIDMLYREMSHRVGNNLNVILNYLDMAQQESTDEHNRSVLAQSQSMVMAVSTVHSALGSRRDEEGGLPLHDHIELLTDQILRSFREADIERDLDLDPVYTDARTLKNCVLIVNELITNACKYAFRGDGQTDALRVSLTSRPYTRGRQEVVLEVADNGPGLSSPWAGGVAEGTGFGQALVSHCAEDMNGVVDVSSDGEGTRVRVTCRVPDPRGDDAPEAPEAIAGAP